MGIVTAPTGSVTNGWADAAAPIAAIAAAMAIRRAGVIPISP